MILHMDGTTPPKAMAIPEHLKAHVYLPPNLVNEFADSHEPIAHIVQSFIEAVGVPTVIRWRRAAALNGWSLSQTGNFPIPSLSHLPLIPEPTKPTSSYYVFPGRPYGSFQPTTQHSSENPHASISPSVENFQSHCDVHDSLYEDDQPDLARVMEENVRLREELRLAQEREAEREAVIIKLRKGLRELVGRQEVPMDDNGSTRPTTPSVRSGGPSALPKKRTSPNPPFSASTRPFGSPTTLKPDHPIPQKSPVHPSTPVHPGYQTPSSPSKNRMWPQMSSHQFHPTEASPLSHMPTSQGFSGGLQSFGPSCEAFIEGNSLGDRLHRQLHELFEGTLVSKWRHTIMGWFDNFDEDAALYLADGLYIAMCDDAKARENVK
jgi:hypothetical protein